MRPLHNLINPQNCDDAVRYIHLSKVPDQYSMGIFVFPPHAKIPLHDHPGMCVMSKVIYGDLHRLCLDLPRKISKAQQKRLGRSWLSWSQPWQVDSATTTPTSQQQRLAFKNHVDHLQAPDCTVLYPYEGNLHEYVSFFLGGGSYFANTYCEKLLSLTLYNFSLLSYIKIRSRRLRSSCFGCFAPTL